MAVKSVLGIPSNAAGAKQSKVTVSSGAKLQLAAAVAIAVYGMYRRKRQLDDPSQTHDPLYEFNLFSNSSPLHAVGDGWSLSHLLGHAVLGFVDPESEAQILELSAAWEAWEYVTSVTGQYLSSGDWWWYAKLSDLFMNYAGFKIGAAAARAVKASNAKQ